MYYLVQGHRVAYKIPAQPYKVQSNSCLAAVKFYLLLLMYFVF